MIQGERMAQGPMEPPPGTGVPPAPRRRVSAAVVFSLVVGAVVGALVVGSIWLLFGDGGGPDVSGSTPDRVGDYGRFADAQVNQSDKGKQNVQRVQDWNRRSAERLSAAHHGAKAAVESYTDDRVEQQFTLLVVDAQVPFPPFVPYQDAAYLGLKRPPDELRELGDVACVVRNDPSPASGGGDDDPKATHVISCVRTGSSTVEIRNVSGDLAGDPQKVADLVNEVWSKL
jgi:hypothetical protein